LYDPGVRYNHFAFVVRRNRIVCVGRNRPFKTHPLSLGYRFDAIHAEVDVIRKLRSLGFSGGRGLKLVCVRVLRSGGFGLARPCVLCSRIVGDFGFDCVVYSSGDDYTFLNFCFDRVEYSVQVVASACVE